MVMQVLVREQILLTIVGNGLNVLVYRFPLDLHFYSKFNSICYFFLQNLYNFPKCLV